MELRRRTTHVHMVHSLALLTSHHRRELIGCPNVAIKTDESNEEDASIYVDVEGDLLKLTEDLYVPEVRPLGGVVEGEGEGEDPAWVAQGQVQEKHIGGT